MFKIRVEVKVRVGDPSIDCCLIGQIHKGHIGCVSDSIHHLEA